MMPNRLKRIGYISTPSRRSPCYSSELRASLDRARERNRTLSVTGILYLSDSYYLQFLEGPYEAVDLVYGIICADDRHTNIRKFVEQDIATRNFASWMDINLKIGINQTPGQKTLTLMVDNYVRDIAKIDSAFLAISDIARVIEGANAKQKVSGDS